MQDIGIIIMYHEVAVSTIVVVEYGNVRTQRSHNRSSVLVNKNCF